MKKSSISVKKRTETGKVNTKKLRRDNMVPCVLYGYEQENIHFYAHENEFKNIVYTPQTYSIDIDIEGNVQTAVLKDIQFHPVTDKIQHIDFLVVQEGRKLKTELLITTKGTPVGIAEGGILLRRARKLNVIGLPEHLPEELTVNIENLNIGDSINVRDVEFENIEILDAPNRVICSVQTAEMHIVEEEEEEDALLLEGEEAPEGEAEDGAEEDSEGDKDEEKSE
ncbi:MAG: 50S ribosomal protein L25 [Bacteroidota bacterium]|nr:50S ribosomal protein L25 [Bacteroidota bacterium]